MKGILVAVVLVVSSVVHADTRVEKVEQLMEAQGLLDMFEQQLSMARAHGEEQGRAMVNRITAGLNPTPEFSARFNEAFEQFRREVETPWSASDIVAVWARSYGAHFSDEELDQLIAHYRSPLGQKEVMASREALVNLTNHFAQAGKPVFERAVTDYVANLRLIAKECNCRR